MVVGTSSGAHGSEAFRWENGFMTGLGTIAGSGLSGGSQAFGVSGDGRVVVGVAPRSLGGFATSQEAFRWENGVMAGLGVLPGYIGSSAQAISGDGLVVVGASFSRSRTEAFRWENGVVQGLGFLGGAFLTSYAEAVNGDGRVVVGTSSSDLGVEAFRWENGVMQGLGIIPSSDPLLFLDSASAAGGVSADGSIVVGSSGTGAFIWDAVNGMRALRDVLVSQLHPNKSLDGWILFSATGISADGLKIAGFGINPSGDWEAYLAELDPPKSKGPSFPTIASTNPGDIFVANPNPKGVIRVDPATGQQTLLPLLNWSSFPMGLTIDANGMILVADLGTPNVADGKIIRIEPTTAQPSLIASGSDLIDPRFIAVGPNGDIYVTQASGNVLRVNRVTGSRTVVSSGGMLFNPRGLVVSLHEIFVAEFALRGLLRIDATTGSQTIVSAGGNFANPGGLAMEGNGDLVVADLGNPNPSFTDGRLIRVNRSTGSQTIISSPGALMNPFGIAIDVDGTLLVTEYGAPSTQDGKLLRIDPATGQQSIISSSGYLYDPAGVAVFPRITEQMIEARLNFCLEFLISLNGVTQPTYGIRTGPNANANRGRLNSLQDHVRSALATSDPAIALTELNAVFVRVDGDPAPPDWITGNIAAGLKRLVSDIIAYIYNFDTDGDGISNGNEITAGTDPLDPNDP